MTCAKVLSRYLKPFLDSENDDFGETLDNIKIYKDCCRRMFYSYIPEIQEILLLYNNEKYVVTSPGFNLSKYQTPIPVTPEK
jgi:DNA-directed RNA polymerase subunit N (RpoN/RPB10)